MTYWWVNQNRTFRQEVEGGYLWSPQTRSDGAYNQFYENMRLVSPGDVIFSFWDTRIQAVGLAKGTAFEAPQPETFGEAGRDWSTIGWQVRVSFTRIAREQQIRPKDHMDGLEPLLPSKYSPLQANGDGLQSVYLAEVPGPMAEALIHLLQNTGVPASVLTPSFDAEQAQAEQEHAIAKVIERAPITETERLALTTARLGQGRFREDVLRVHRRCPVTDVDNPDLLIASHIRPWSRCENNAQRVDPANGLALTPTVDYLFDHGWITFTDGGDLVRSPSLPESDFLALGLPSSVTLPSLSGAHGKRRSSYLEYHRAHIFRA